MDDQILYEIEIFQTPMKYIAEMKSHLSAQKPYREYKGPQIEDILEQMVRDILDEQED